MRTPQESKRRMWVRSLQVGKCALCALLAATWRPVGETGERTAYPLIPHVGDRAGAGFRLCIFCLRLGRVGFVIFNHLIYPR